MIEAMQWILKIELKYCVLCFFSRCQWDFKPAI